MTTTPLNLNVLFISDDPTLFVADSAARMRMRQYADALGTLHIVSRTSTHTAVELTEGTLHLHGVPGGRLSGRVALLTRARALLKQEPIQIVSAQDPFEHGWIAVQALTGSSAKLHVQVHTDFLSPWYARGSLGRAALNTVRVLIADQVLPKAHGIRVVSKRIQDELVKRYGKRVVAPAVLPIASSVDGTPSQAPLPRSQNVTFIAASRLEPEKRLQDVIDALALVQHEHPTVELVIAGRGRERRVLEHRAQQYCQPHTVHFLGERTDVRACMQGADAFVQASAFEGYGRTFIEAALARIPIVTTDVGIIGEVFKANKDALVVQPRDVVGLAAAMKRIVEDAELRKQLVENASRAVTTHLRAYENQPKQIAEDLARLVQKA